MTLNDLEALKVISAVRNRFESNIVEMYHLVALTWLRTHTG